MKRTLLTVLFLLTVLSGAWTLQFEGTVVSPAAGNWENLQPLIVAKADDCEVYYSLSGSDPLISGFAYDGPIILDGTGEQKLTLVSVSERGISDIVSITYSSNGRPTPSYIPLTTRDVYIRVTDKTSISIPETVRWAAGVSANQADPSKSAFHTGGELNLNGRCDVTRVLPLIINTTQGYYRYLLRVGIDIPSLPAPVPEYQGIDFAQWNYIRFNNGRPSLYSIDGSPWQQTVKPVYLDRTVEHSVSWKELKPVTKEELYDDYEGEAENSVQTMVIPPKPEFDLPEKSWTSKAVMLSFPSDDFLLEYKDADGHSHYQNSFGISTVPGDSEGISKQFTIYCKGIKQGTADISFLLNRRIPDGPVINSNAADGFSRSDVVLKFHSSETVYYKVSILANRPYGFDFATDDLTGVNYEAPLQGTDDYLRLAEGEIVLSVNPDAALLYRVTAYSEDVAGNRSDFTNYSVIVDGVNLYVADTVNRLDAEYLKNAPRGTMNNPFDSLNDALSAAERGNFLNPRVFIYGTHHADTPVTIQKNVRLTGKNDARIICSENAEILITGGSVSISDMTLEKRETTDAAGASKCLILMKNASLSLYDSELFTSFATNGIVIKADNSAINIKKCGMTTRASTYTAIVSSNDTKLFLYNVRGVASAPTAVGISAQGGMSFLADCNLSVIGSLGRIAEYVNLSWVLEACNLYGSNTIPVESAIWTDYDSILRSEKANTFSGFSRLSVKAEK